MAKLQLPPDFRDFLKLLNENEVRYLLIDGYAVGYHGYPRATADMDIWIDVDLENAERMVRVMESFGFEAGSVSTEAFLNREGVVRLGVPPLRLEILKQISGVHFKDCYRNRIEDEIDDVLVEIISLEDLRENKQHSGRLKDLSDLEHLAMVPLDHPTKRR